MKTDQEKQAIIAEYHSLVKKGGATKQAIIESLAKKHKFGVSTFQTWLANGKAKRKVSKKISKPAEKKWETLYDKYIRLRDEAAQAKKELVEYVERLR